MYADIVNRIDRIENDLGIVKEDTYICSWCGMMSGGMPERPFGWLCEQYVPILPKAYMWLDGKRTRVKLPVRKVVV